MLFSVPLSQGSRNVYYCTTGDTNYYYQASVSGSNDSATNNDVTASSCCAGKFVGTKYMLDFKTLLHCKVIHMTSRQQLYDGSAVTLTFNGAFFIL